MIIVITIIIIISPARDAFRVLQEGHIEMACTFYLKQLECQEGGRGAKVFISRWSFQHRLDCSARDVLGAKLG